MLYFCFGIIHTTSLVENMSSFAKIIPHHDMQPETNGKSFYVDYHHEGPYNTHFV